MADDPRIVLAVQTSSDLSGIKAARTETAAYAKDVQATGQSFEGISPHVRRAASEFAVLTQVAVSGDGSLAGIANTAGMAGQSIAALAGTARVAMLASGIGAIITVGAAVIGVLVQMNKEAKATQEEMDHVANINSHGIDAQLAQAAKQRDAAKAAYEAGLESLAFRYKSVIPGTDANELKKASEQTQAYFDLIFNRSQQLHTEEANAARTRQVNYTRQYNDQMASLDLQTREARAQTGIAGDMDTQARERHRQMTDELATQQRQTRESYNQYDAQGQLIELLPEEKQQRDEILASQRRLNEAQQEAYDRQIKMQKVQADSAAQTRIQQAEAAQATGRDAGGNSVQQQRFAAAIAGYQAEEDAAVKNGESRTNAERETALKISAYRKKLADDEEAVATRIRAARSDLDPNNIEEMIAARTQEYDDQRKAAIANGEDETQAATEMNLKVRALRKQTSQDAMQNYAAITDAMLSSNNRAVKAVGMVADTVRRVMIGADGAHSAVLAVKEGAAAIGAAASGNFAAAALHAESALAYGKAAALALKESLGSGGSAGGGGSSSGSSSTTFEPSERQGSGNMTVVLNSVDPYSGAAINTVAYELQRGQVLNKPIVIPPTTGLSPAMG